jgi:HK97 family phage major capsid protein
MSSYTRANVNAVLHEGTKIMSRSALNALRSATAERVAPKQPPKIRTAPAAQAREPLRFKSLAEQLISVRRACAEGSPEIDARLVRAPTGMGEIDPGLGGFAVETQYATELVGLAYEEAVIAPLCDRREKSAPLASIKVPAVDETSRQGGSRWGGVLSYWSTEGAQVSASIPKFRQIEFSTKKLQIVIIVTNELFADVAMLDAHVRRAFADEAAFMLDLCIVRGDGAGKPLGFLNSTALMTIAKETGQVSQTVVAQNVAKMWSALPAPSRRRAVWLVNEDMEQQLEAMSYIFGTAGAPAPTASALYMPAGANGNDFPLLKGRPVLAIEQCQPTGTIGDIVLADLRHYILVEGAMTTALSVHADFLSDQTIYRFTLRVDGQSAFSSPITPYNGSANKRSPFVALAAR